MSRELERGDVIRWYWEPWMAHLMGWQPWDLDDLRPAEMIAARKYASATPPGVF